MRSDYAPKILMLILLLGASGVMICGALYLVLAKSPQQKARAYYELAQTQGKPADSEISPALLHAITLDPFAKPLWHALEELLQQKNQTALVREVQGVSEILKEPQ